MVKEIRSALQGIKQPLALHHRATIVLLGFVWLYLLLWALHMFHSGRNYFLLVIALVGFLVLAPIGTRLFRMAVLSPPKTKG